MYHILRQISGSRWMVEHDTKFVKITDAVSRIPYNSLRSWQTWWQRQTLPLFLGRVAIVSRDLIDEKRPFRSLMHTLICSRPGHAESSCCSAATWSWANACRGWTTNTESLLCIPWLDIQILQWSEGFRSKVWEEAPLEQRLKDDIFLNEKNLIYDWFSWCCWCSDYDVLALRQSLNSFRLVYIQWIDISGVLERLRDCTGERWVEFH